MIYIIASRCGGRLFSGYSISVIVAPVSNITLATGTAFLNATRTTLQPGGSLSKIKAQFRQLE
jgi:hypothetical protein